ESGTPTFPSFFTAKFRPVTRALATLMRDGTGDGTETAQDGTGRHRTPTFPMAQDTHFSDGTGHPLFRKRPNQKRWLA
ncbi:MAG: hypothetical protein COS34_05740, partial [Lysobacterales bacterium CG02_land_8_20_14_3_00_62_12]